MGKNYVINSKTGRIHIIGYCHYTNPVPLDWKRFSTEEEARASYGGQSAGLCKICLYKREGKIEKGTK